MNIDNRFASRAESVEATPEPFRRALREHLPTKEPISFLAHAPAYTGIGERSPATVLAVTDQRWLVVAEGEDGSAEVCGATFDDTLLLELTEILLLGQLKIDFVSNGEPHFGAVQFNDVMGELYREAMQLVLDGIENVSPVTNDEASNNEAPSLSDWPIKFCNDVLHSVLKGRQLLFATHWPALIGGFRRELAPAAALALTDRELVLIAEEKSWEWLQSPRREKYGRIATYFPLARLAQHSVTRHEKFNILELEAHAQHGGEKLQIMFPSRNESGVSELMNRALALIG